MEYVFLLKPLVDMLYEFQVLDVLLLFICILFLFSPRCKLTDTIEIIDVIVLILVVLFFLSFVRNINGWAQFLKIESSFLLYFIGRSYKVKNVKVLHFVQIGFLPVIAITLFAIISGIGFVMWGQVNTFRGFYYFKTDLALAMTQCFVVFSFFNYFRKLFNYCVLFLCIFFILLSNSRIYYLIMTLVIFLCICHYFEKKMGRVILRLNVRFMLYIFSLIFFTIIIMVLVNKVLNGRFLLIDMSSGLYSDANTQGRNVVWAEIYKIFSNRDLYTRLTGIDLCSDVSPSLGFNSHNNYLKILFSTGYIGLIFFTLFLAYVVRTINALDNRRFFYVTLCFFLIYIVGGISYITIESTQGTWLTMFVIGNAVNYESRKMHFNKIIDNISYRKEFF